MYEGNSSSYCISVLDGAKTYAHVYGLCVELGKPMSGPLYEDLINAYKEVMDWCSRHLGDAQQ